MALVEINWKPADKTVRDFGNISPLATLVLVLILHFWRDLPLKTCSIIFAAGIAIFLIRLISLTAAKYIFIVFSAVTAPIGIVVSFVVLLIFYYLIITPVALFFRITGRDVLTRKFDHQVKTYWLPHKKTPSLKQYFNQF